MVRSFVNRIVLGLVLVVCACSSKPTCDATSCAAGCCDSSGICQAGTAADACGAPGSGTCGVCTAAQACVANACAAVAVDGGTGGGDGGSGGGTTGGGSATGGGLGGGSAAGGGTGNAGGGTGSAGGGTGNVGGGTGSVGGGSSDAGPYDDGGMHYCVTTRTISTFSGPIIDAGFDGYTWVIESIPDPDGGYDALDLETYINTQANQPVPGFSALDAGTATGGSTNYSDCGVCPILFEGCIDAAFTCSRVYLGISGDVNVLASTQDRPGATYATVSNLTFVEWDFSFDGPVHDGQCVVVGSAILDAGWQ
jgi:hypothetical protein